MARLGQLLVQSGALGPGDLERGLSEHRRSGGKLGAVLVRLSLVTETQVAEALGAQLHLPVTPLEPPPTPEPALLARIPASLAHAAGVLPLELQEEGRVLVVATDGPLRGERLEQLRTHACCWILPKLAPETALRRALIAAYGPPPEPLPSSPVPPPVPVEGQVPSGPRHPEVQALVQLLLDKGLLSHAELEAAFAAARGPTPALFKKESP